MWIPPVHVGHPDVERIQPTWHCVQRFRERHAFEWGTDVAITRLGAALNEAQITTRPPAGVRTRGDWSLWAVCGALAFPLVDQGGGTWLAPTCLAARR